MHARYGTVIYTQSLPICCAVVNLMKHNFMVILMRSLSTLQLQVCLGDLLDMVTVMRWSLQKQLLSKVATTVSFITDWHILYLQIFLYQCVHPPIQDARNTVGNIPLSWYDDYPHIGYDLDGTKIMKPAKGDEVSIVLDRRALLSYQILATFSFYIFSWTSFQQKWMTQIIGEFCRLLTTG